MKFKNLFFSVIIILFVSVPVFAVDFIVGAKAGYYAWDPYIKDVPGSGFSEIDMGVGILYGPVISVLFTENISLSLAGLMGVQSAHWLSKVASHESYYTTGTFYFESRRTDIDAALNYRILQNFKVFLGYKYQHIVSKLRYTELRTDSSLVISEIDVNDDEIETPSHGPALGIGYSLPFGKGFFVAANLSGLYMRGRLTVNESWKLSYSVFNDPHLNEGSNKETKWDTEQMGVNFEPSIGFSAGESGLIFTLGFRYQWLRTKIDGDLEPGTKWPDMDDYLYGIFISVLYSF